MPGLVPGIHDFLKSCKQGVGGRDKPGHDAEQEATGEIRCLVSFREKSW